MDIMRINYYGDFNSYKFSMLIYMNDLFKKYYYSDDNIYNNPKVVWDEILNDKNNEYTYNDLAVIKYTDYKFVLALENGIDFGYLTEKLINPILANSIPIYAGPNDIFDIINSRAPILFSDIK